MLGWQLTHLGARPSKAYVQETRQTCLKMLSNSEPITHKNAYNPRRQNNNYHNRTHSDRQHERPMTSRVVGSVTATSG